ncbi:BAG domain-containing protein Samui isoform X2 [Episyrphus balteatus]|uniref:BAG domain-containing protein Samui isoform X2 n=1 Tax=Episyrphus balteatus TaxID=286459 RepID=UPI002486B174|nr:BAG domain-containing protein Samui isoform X2 [Episyrphus balteatus]
MPNSNATTTTNPAQGAPNANGTYSSTQQIPINHHHHNAATAGMDMPQGYHQAGFGSPSGGTGGGGRQPQFPPHFQQGFGFDPDIDDMFSDAGLRSHLGRMRADPFGTFGSHFPQFGSLGRSRRAGTGAGIPKATDGMQHDDFFERLPPEFRQYIPDGFGSMRRQGGNGGAGAAESPRIPTQQPQYYQTYVQPGTTPPNQATTHTQQQQQQQSPPVAMRNVCDAAIQTEDPSVRSEVDGHHLNADNLNHHGLRNTVDMGVRTPSESEGHNSRSHSAPPQQPEQQNYPQDQQGFHSQGTGTQRNTPPPQQRQYPANQQPPRFPKAYNPQTYATHPQQPSTPQTPGGSYIRTIPIFVEGRSEPLINHKDIPQAEAPQQPNQNYTKAAPQAQQQQHYQQQQQPQQQHHQNNRPTPINTHQQPTAQQQQGPPPATPHTMESINKIQDIQRDVLNLMTKVENFTGLRSDKEYAYLDEMLTRNLLKLDTIDTQGKESIRLARKEAIKCIQASINVLEAKAEENAKTAQPQEAVIDDAASKVTAPAEESAEAQPIDVSNVHEAIPLPPPESLKTGSGSSENVPASNKGSSPPKEEAANTTTTNTTNEAVTKSSSGLSAKGELVNEAKSE